MPRSRTLSGSGAQCHPDFQAVRMTAALKPVRASGNRPCLQVWILAACLGLPLHAGTPTAAALPLPHLQQGPPRLRSKRASPIRKRTFATSSGLRPARASRVLPRSFPLEKPKFTYDSARCQEGPHLDRARGAPSHPYTATTCIASWAWNTACSTPSRTNCREQRALRLSAGGSAPFGAAGQPLHERAVYRRVHRSAAHAFQGHQGKRLRGDAALISGSSDEKRLFYFGYGVATVAWWTLRGPVLMDFSYVNAPARRRCSSTR